jgi:hypothetical protein
MTNHLVWVITVWVLVIGGGYVAVLFFLVGRRGRLRIHYRRHVEVETARERLFIASVAFFITFAIVRLLTHSIHAGRGPFHDVVTSSGRHFHHMVWGIWLLLIVGYVWLAQVGTGMGGASKFCGRLFALLYGIGAALTLDEFALWLNLRDVYWEREGRASVDAVLLFGALLSIGIFGGRFFHSLAREAFGLGNRSGRR